MSFICKISIKCNFNFKLDLYKIIILTNYVHYNFNKFSNITLFYLIILTNYVHYNFNKFSNITLFYLIFFALYP